MLQEHFLSGGEKNEEQNAYNLGAKELYLLDEPQKPSCLVTILKSKLQSYPELKICSFTPKHLYIILSKTFQADWKTSLGTLTLTSLLEKLFERRL